MVETVFEIDLIDEREVDRARVQAAKAILEFCRTDLDLPAIDLKWYRGGRQIGLTKPGERSWAAGMFQAGTIALACDLSESELLEAAAHEARHYWQSIHDRNFDYYTSPGFDPLEDDAANYAAKTVTRYRQGGVQKGFGSPALARACMRRGW